MAFYTIGADATDTTTAGTFPVSTASPPRPWGPVMALVWAAGIWIFSFFACFGLHDLGVIHALLPDGRVDINMVEPISLPLQILCILLVASRLTHNPLDALALRVPAQPVRLVLVVAGLLGAALLAEATVHAISTFWFEQETLTNPNQQTIEAAIERTSLLRSLVLTAILAPIAEELLFRGLLLRAFAQTRLGFWGAAVVTSVLFALAHVATADPLVLAPYLFTGMACACGLRCTGSLWGAIAVHCLKNGIAVLLLSL